MQRFFIKLENLSGDRISITEKNQIHHIKDVLRLKIKEQVCVVDEKGNEYFSEIEQLAAEKIVAKVKEVRKANPNAGIKLTIACAIPKKSKFDDIVDRLTQLGVERIIPMITERVIIKLDKAKSAARQARWKKIALSAAQQSQRNVLPIVSEIKKLEEVLAESGDFDLKLIPALFSRRQALREVLGKAKPKKVLVLIGPEGDFSDEEMKMAVKSGFVPVTLGDMVLRVETAAVAVASYFKLFTETGTVP